LTERARRYSKKFGTSVFFVNGRNGVRVLGALSKICRIKHVAYDDEGVYFEVPSKHNNQIIAILNNLCYNYKIVKNKGAVPLAINSFARLGFALGVLVVAVFLLIYPTLITRVSIGSALGNGEAVDAALKLQIDDILRSYGISEGKLIPKLDEAGIENSILALDGVAFASVKRVGTHVEIIVKPELKKDYFVEVKGSKVTAKRLAVVTRVIVEGGTGVVKYGDVVREGDVLIDGYTLYGDDKLDVEAKGVVYGKVYRKKTVFFADNAVVKEISRTKKITKLSMFSKVPKTPKSPFENYELHTEINDFGFLLPFKIYTYEFREISEREEVNTLSGEEMINRVYAQIVSEFEEPLKVLEKFDEIREADGGKYVSVTVATEEVIS